ncbi:MAG TPA: GNAT family N-acetyltransferase [Kofleriaceae bacterium]|nr:GNAT family N-acetyltransferase [Kofleriaceae bacterium]
MTRIEILWGDLRAIEPTREELMQYSAALAEGYNHPANATLMGHSSIISPREVVESYEQSMAEGMRAFLLFAGDAFAGDGDLRNFRRSDVGATAEFAFMVAMPAAQGKGLGTRFATMVHAFGFTRLSLERIYASVVPENTASKRVFEKLGYVVDDSPEGREYAEEPGDITLSLTYEGFVERHRALLEEIRIGVR